MRLAEDILARMTRLAFGGYSRSRLDKRPASRALGAPPKDRMEWLRHPLPHIELQLPPPPVAGYAPEL
jgi:hypothetical protein